jgi:hypothetical protein
LKAPSCCGWWRIHRSATSTRNSFRVEQALLTGVRSREDAEIVCIDRENGE